METKPITLPTLSWQMLKEVLGSTGWALTPKAIFIAGRLDEEDRLLIPKYPSQPVTTEEDLAWKKEAITFVFSDTEIEVLKNCITIHVGRGSFPATRYTKALLAAFGVTAS